MALGKSGGGINKQFTLYFPYQDLHIWVAIWLQHGVYITPSGKHWQDGRWDQPCEQPAPWSCLMAQWHAGRERLSLPGQETAAHERVLQSTCMCCHVKRMRLAAELWREKKKSLATEEPSATAACLAVAHHPILLLSDSISDCHTWAETQKRTFLGGAALPG